MHNPKAQKDFAILLLLWQELCTLAAAHRSPHMLCQL